MMSEVKVSVPYPVHVALHGWSNIEMTTQKRLAATINNTTVCTGKELAVDSSPCRRRHPPPPRPSSYGGRAAAFTSPPEFPRVKRIVPPTFCSDRGVTRSKERATYGVPDDFVAWPPSRAEDGVVKDI